MVPVLWSLSYSPWSERARWALEYRGVEHERRSYRPLIDEPALRRKLRRWRGPVSVPMLETDAGVIDDSFGIAEFADQHGSEGAPLMPDADRERIRSYNALADRGMSAGRSCSLHRVLGDESSLLDLVPRNMRRVLGPMARTVAAVGVRRTLRKYAPVTSSDPSATLGEVLDTLRDELAAGSTDDRGVAHLLASFSYADVTMAQVLAFVEPPATHLRLTDATRGTYRDPLLAERYADLVVWRDALYAEYREPLAPR